MTASPWIWLKLSMLSHMSEITFVRNSSAEICSTISRRGLSNFPSESRLQDCSLRFIPITRLRDRQRSSPRVGNSWKLSMTLPGTVSSSLFVRDRSVVITVAEVSGSALFLVGENVRSSKSVGQKSAGRGGTGGKSAGHRSTSGRNLRCRSINGRSIRHRNTGSRIASCRSTDDRNASRRIVGRNAGCRGCIGQSACRYCSRAMGGSSADGRRTVGSGVSERSTGGTEVLLADALDAALGSSSK